MISKVKIFIVLVMSLLAMLLLKRNKENFIEVEDNENVLILFYANWCGYCTKFKPIWEKLEAKYKNSPSIKIVSKNIDTNKDLAKKFKIESLPTILVFKKGKRLSNYEGDRSLKSLSKFIDSKIV